MPRPDYARDAEENKEFDEAVKGGTLEDLREGVKVRKREAEESNKDFGNRLIQSIGAETAVGIAADILLPSPDPISRGLNFGIGYGANVLSQLYRGQEFSHGEAVAAGGFQAIPFGTVAKGAKGLYRAGLKGAAGSVVGEQVRVGIDEQRLLTFPEAVRAGAFGGTIGTTFKGTTQLGKRIIHKIDTVPNPLKLAEFAGGTGTGFGPKRSDIIHGKYYTEGVKTSWPITKSMKEKLSLHDRALYDEGLHFDAPAENRRRLIDNQLDPKGPLTLFTKSDDLKRKVSAWALTGEEITPEVDAEFISEGKRILKGYEKRLGASVGLTDIHHKGLLRQIFEAANGLNPVYKRKSGDFMERRLGHALGYDPSAAEPLPRKFHTRLHNLINKRIGIGGYNLKGIERKFGLPKNWKHILTYNERLPIYREIIDTITDSENQIRVFWNGLLKRGELSKAGKEEYMSIVLDVLNLDKRLEQTPGIGFSAGQDYTASEIINDILIKAGRVDLKLPIFQKLNNNEAEEAARILMDNNGRKALIEAIRFNKPVSTVLKAFNPDADKAVIKSIEQKWVKQYTTRNRLLDILEDTDIEGDKLDLKLLHKLIQDPDF